MKIHAEILKKAGKPEFAVLPYDEFVLLNEKLEELEDLLDLRKAKKQTKKTLSLKETRTALGL